MDPDELHRVALRMLADYDAGRPNEIFAEHGTDWLTLDDAYAVQRALAELRRARGERLIGYKVGCVGAAIQHQFGLHEPVRGYVWAIESHHSGCHLSHTRFANLAIEGEIALRVSHDIPPDILNDGGDFDDLCDCVDCWFPVIELHNYVFRGAVPTSQELVAGNAMHAGFVASPFPTNHSVATIRNAEIQVELQGDRLETNKLSSLWGGLGPLRSLSWLVASLASTRELLKAGDIVLTSSPERLIRINASCVVAVTCEGMRVEFLVADVGAFSGPA